MPRRSKRKVRSEEQIDASAAASVHGKVKKSRRSCQRDDSFFALSSQDEDLLGRSSSSAEWLIKIAQGRGSSVSLAIDGIDAMQWHKDEIEGTLKTHDGQLVPFRFSGPWTAAFAESHLPSKPAKLDQKMMLSGHGASIAPSAVCVKYETGRLTLKVLQDGGETLSASERLLQEWYEVDKGVLKGQTLCDPSAGTEVTSLVHARQPVQAEKTLDPLGPLISAAATSAARSAADTPDWLRTPGPRHAIERHQAQGNHWTPMTSASPLLDRADAVVASDLRETTLARRTGTAELLTAPRASHTDSEPETRTKKKDKAHMITKIRMIGDREYVPISMIPTSELRGNIIGVLIADSNPRRASGGDQDWHIRIVLRDLHNLKVKNSACITINIFAKTEDDLPRCPEGSIIALVNAQFRPFNGRAQGVGRIGQTQWFFLNSRESNGMCIKDSGMVDVSAEEQAMIRGQHRIYREDYMNLGIDHGPRGRPLLKLCEIAPDRFFDTHVEVVKIWDRSHPPMIYVTDYTSNPLLHIAPDVNLQAMSREEIQRLQAESNDSGNGHVLAVALWGPEAEIVPQLKTGMHVRLVNVRPKKQSANGFIEGALHGDDDTSKLCIMILVDDDARSIAKARIAYLQKVEALRAGDDANNCLDSTLTTPLHLRSEVAPSPREESSQALPISFPPDGQAVLTNTQERAEDNVFRCPGGLPKDSLVAQMHISPSVEYTQLDDQVAQLPCTSLADILSLKQKPDVSDKAIQRVFRCRVQILDMKPKQLRDIVHIQCGLCKKILPSSESMCKECAEMDGKDLRHEYLFAFLVCDARDGRHGSPTVSLRPKQELPLLIKEAEALHFLHNFHPRDVRERETTRARLQSRLAPILGPRLAAVQDQRTSASLSGSGAPPVSTYSPTNLGAPFDVGILVSKSTTEALAHKSALTFCLVHTRLIKARAILGENGRA